MQLACPDAHGAQSACDGGAVSPIPITDDISDDTKIVRRHAEVTGVVRRRRWSDEEQGRIVAEAIAPGAVIADVARRSRSAATSNWIRAAKEGEFALPADAMPAFVPVVSVESTQATKTAHERRLFIEIEIGTVKVRVPSGTDARDVEAILCAIRRFDV